MFQGCTGNRQNLALSGKAISRLLLVWNPRDLSSELRGLVQVFHGAQPSTLQTDDLFLLQIASAIPSPLARLIYTIRNFDWTLCASHNYRHFFQRRTAHWLRFALLSNLAAGAGPVGVACLQLICRDAAAIFALLELRISHSGPRPTTQLASHRLAAN